MNWIELTIYYNIENTEDQFLKDFYKLLKDLLLVPEYEEGSSCGRNYFCIPPYLISSLNIIYDIVNKLSERGVRII